MGVRIPLAWNLNKPKSCVLKYSIHLTSLIPINRSRNLINVYKNKFFKKGCEKLLIKKSYLLLTWISYNTKIVKKSFFNKPKKYKRLTFTKSPMAHKTFSQEQMKFERYKTLITYFNNINKNLNNLNKSINFIIKKRYLEKRLTLGSNLLITDKINTKVKFKEKAYFRF